MEKSKKLYNVRSWQLAVSSFLLMLLSTNISNAAVSAMRSDENLIEKKKTVTYSYSINSSDKISLENQFGDIKVQLWDKSEFKVDITITANASTEGRAVDYINAVDIAVKKTDGQISVKTFIDKDDFGTSWSSGKNGEKTGLKVDYQVFMPKNNALRVKNSFGDITLPDFQAVLDVDENYGTFTAEDLSNAQNDIDVKFGKAFIKTLKGGKLNVSYSHLTLDKADDIFLYNSFGKFDVKEVGKCEGKISYSSGSIGVLKESAKMKVEFSGGFKFGSIAKTVNNVDLNAQYSTVVLPLEDGGNYDFDVKVSYGGFDYPSNTTFTKNSEEDAKKEKHNYSFNPTKYYSGKIGKGGGKIVVNSSFGAVKIK